MIDVIGSIIVLYNPREGFTKKLSILSEYTRHLVIIDNSIEPNLKYFPSNCTYLHFPKNIGLAKALNIGSKLLREKGCKWFVYFDQDTEIPENLEESYLRKIYDLDSNVGMLSPLYDIDRKRTPKEKNFLKDVLWSMTSCSIFNLDILDKLGYFDERYFLDVVDYEYCLRLHKNNFRVLQFFGFSVKHNPGITKNFFFIKYGYMSPLRFYYQIRNLKLLFKEYKKIQIKILLVIKIIKVILFFNNKFTYFRAYETASNDFKNNVFYKKESL